MDIPPPAEYSETIDSNKKNSAKLISNLGLLGVKVTIENYGIVEPNNKDPDFSTYPPTFRSKNQGSDSLTFSLKFVLPKPKCGDMTDSASPSTYRSGTFPSQYYGFSSILTRLISPTSLLEQKDTKFDNLNQYKDPT